MILLEAQFAQQATSSSTTPGRLPSKCEVNPREQCNCVTLRGGVEESMDMELEKGAEVSRVVGEEKNAEFESNT